MPMGLTHGVPALSLLVILLLDVGLRDVCRRLPVMLWVHELLARSPILQLLLDGVLIHLVASLWLHLAWILVSRGVLKVRLDKLDLERSEKVSLPFVVVIASRTARKHRIVAMNPIRLAH